MTTAFQLVSTRLAGSLNIDHNNKLSTPQPLKLNSKNVSFKKKAYHEHSQNRLIDLSKRLCIHTGRINGT